MKTSLFYLMDHYPDRSGPVADRYAAVIDQSVQAESLGYESVWLAEHHFHQLGTLPNPAVMLAAIAARTTTLRLGPAVAVLPMRPPLYTAENYAMVDNISAGRLNLGVGSGSSPFELAGVGLDPDQAREAFGGAVAEVERRLAGASAGDLGYDTLNIAPVQAPCPPMYVTASSPESAHRAGTQGRSILMIATPGTPSTAAIGDRIRAHRAGLSEAGHDPDSRDAVVVAFGFVAPDVDDARSLAGAALARTIERMGGPQFDPNDLYDKMVSAGTAVLGDPPQAAALMQGFADQGVAHMAFLNGFGALPIDANATSITLLAKAAGHVVPALDARDTAPTAAKAPAAVHHGHH